MLSTPLTCVRTHCRTSLVSTAILHSYALLVCCQHRRPVFARIAEPRWYPLLFYIRTCCISATIAAGYIHTRFSSAVYIVDLRSLAELLWYPLLSYICTRCSSAVNIVDLHRYMLQNLIATHSCLIFLHTAYLPPLPLARSVHAAHLPSTSSTCVRLQSFFGTHCYPTFVRTARLPSKSLTCVPTH